MLRRSRQLRVASVVAGSVVALACVLAAGAATGADRPRLRLGTTTSTENSGLLRVLLPPFEARCGCTVDVIAVGTGKALKLGERGDVDVVLVHARPLEDRFVAEGWGVDRRDVMHNDFVVIGPPADPAQVKAAKDAVEAFRRIERTRAPFVSRGDASGTHEAELEVWRRAGLAPRGSWYLDAGQGMSEVITMAAERGAYTLSDRGTYLAHPRRRELPVLFQGDPVLFNPYGVIAVNPARHPAANHALAEQFIDFLTGPQGKALITGYRVGGEQLFFVGSR
jgi:tungstate transport system substrate-binding protein